MQQVNLGNLSTHKEAYLNLLSITSGPFQSAFSNVEGITKSGTNTSHYKSTNID